MGNFCAKQKPKAPEDVCIFEHGQPPKPFLGAVEEPSEQRATSSKTGGAAAPQTIVRTKVVNRPRAAHEISKARRNKVSHPGGGKSKSFAIAEAKDKRVHDSRGRPVSRLRPRASPRLVATADADSDSRMSPADCNATAARKDSDQGTRSTGGTGAGGARVGAGAERAEKTPRVTRQKAGWASWCLTS